MVAGAGRTFICNECIATCNDYTSKGASDRSARTPLEQSSTARLLALLKPIEETITGKSNQLQSVVEVLRTQKVSWAIIGVALDVSRQSARERFAHAEVR
jgi:hypothetical protein